MFAGEKQSEDKLAPYSELHSVHIDASVDIRTVNRATGASHKWETLIVWVGAWAGSFWLLVCFQNHTSTCYGRVQGFQTAFCHSLVYDIAHLEHLIVQHRFQAVIINGSLMDREILTCWVYFTRNR